MMLGPILARRWFTFGGLIGGGRFIRLRERFTVYRLIRGCDLDRRAGLELILPVHNDLFSFFQPAVDQRLSAVDRSDLDRAHLGCFVSSNHISKGSVRSVLHHGSRNH